MRKEFSPRVPEFCTEADINAANDQNYWHGRWAHYRQAAWLLMSLCNDGPVLEVGPYNCPLVKNAVCMDTMDHGVGAVRWDAGVENWPFHRGTFASVLALQVIEHIHQPFGQRIFFSEAARVARSIVVVSVPWKWDDDSDHGRIDDGTMLEWSFGTEPIDSNSCVGVPGKERRVFAYDAARIRANMDAFLRKTPVA